MPRPPEKQSFGTDGANVLKKVKNYNGNKIENQNESLKLKIWNDELDDVQKEQNTKNLGIQIDNSSDWMEKIKIVSSKVS